MSNAVIALLIGLGFALVLGYFVARSSARREKIYGGQAAHALNYIASAGVAGTLPVVLASLILRGGFGLAFPLAVSFMVVSLISLVIFAIIELPARSKATGQGWTEQDARTSGL